MKIDFITPLISRQSRMARSKASDDFAPKGLPATILGAEAFVLCPAGATGLSPGFQP
jgi:hypothetical protein